MFTFRCSIDLPLVEDSNSSVRVKMSSLSTSTDVPGFTSAAISSIFSSSHITQPESKNRPFQVLL